MMIIKTIAHLWTNLYCSIETVDSLAVFTGQVEQYSQTNLRKAQYTPQLTLMNLFNVKYSERMIFWLFRLRT